ncbi:MAG: hypothetical protein A2Z99_13440 [Treponema sp. GWB1_62_6]|nr:MAG: hypothetical protein A2Z99_13440 [Treponema sp. GWB1_62_6]
MVIGVISPILVLMIISKGISLGSVGYIMAMLSAFVVIFEIPSGILSDRFGRKAVYLISLLFFLVSFSIILIGQGLLAIGIGFCLFGLGRAFSSGSIESDFIDLYLAEHGKDNLHKIILGMNIGETIGLALGALLGGFMPSLWSALFPGDNIYNGNIFIQIVLVIVLFILTGFAHTERSAVKHESLGSFLHDSISLIKANKVIKLLLAGILVWGFSFNAIEIYWQPQLKDILGSEKQTWLFGALNSGYFLMSVIGALAVGSFISLTKLSQFSAIGILKIALGVTIVVLAFQGRFIGFSILFLLVMGFNGMLGVPESTVFNIEIPADKRSSLLSLSSLAMQVGGIVASVFFSLVIARTTIAIVWAVAGTAFGFSSILYFHLDRHAKGRLSR